MVEYIKFSVGKELKEKQNELIEKVNKTGKIRIGVNETTTGLPVIPKPLTIPPTGIPPSRLSTTIVVLAATGPSTVTVPADCSMSSIVTLSITFTDTALDSLYKISISFNFKLSCIL